MTPMTETAKLEALKPCPFCGGDKIFVQNAGWQANTFMRCPGCRITMSIDNGSPRAHVDTVAAWNTRALSVSRPAVKGLEWKAEDIGCTAQTDLGEWAVDHDDDKDVAGTPWSAWGPQESIGHFSTEEAAKAAAQSDFEQRILSSLSPPTGEWRDAKPDELEAAIADFKAKLPGWWYSVGECQVSCDASCAPTVESEHIGLIQHSDDPFDSGFHADLRQPSTLAEALRTVMRDALSEIEVRSALTKKEGQ